MNSARSRYPTVAEIARRRGVRVATIVEEHNRIGKPGSRKWHHMRGARVTAALRKLGGIASTDEINRETGLGRETVTNLCAQLVRDGAVERIVKGRNGERPALWELLA